MHVCMYVRYKKRCYICMCPWRIASRVGHCVSTGSLKHKSFFTACWLWERERETDRQTETERIRASSFNISMCRYVVTCDGSFSKENKLKFEWKFFKEVFECCFGYDCWLCIGENRVGWKRNINLKARLHPYLFPLISYFFVFMSTCWLEIYFEKKKELMDCD